jgi:iron complex outermembrane receptor protein
MDLGEVQINSTNLGKHSRLHEAGAFGFVPKLGGRLNADFRFRLDHYQEWSNQESVNLDLGYDIIDNRFKIRGSYSRAFRIPSFTELYYSDPANKGSPNLKVEKSDNFRLGFNFNKDSVEVSADGFLRRGRNLIDWVRALPIDPWQATNLGRVDFRGVEFSLGLKRRLDFGAVKLEKMVFSYNYTSADKKISGFFSKYALDILKHQYIFEIYSALRGINFNWQLSYNQRYYGERYFVGNLYIGKKFSKNGFAFEPFVKIDNFSDTRYSEIAGVLEPGRWIKSGLKFEW